MPIELAPFGTIPPALAYARLLRELHALINHGQGDSQEAETLTDLMDDPWYAMTPEERARMRGLAADLNALGEGGPRRVTMSADDLAAWKRAVRESYDRGEAGEVDVTLNFLRRPVPDGLPRQIIPFLQSRCWEKLGDLETALVFMREAERHDPGQTFSVMVLLQQLGRVEELPRYAKRVIDDPASPPLEHYVAALALLEPARQMTDAEAKPILKQVAEVLGRALAEYLALPRKEQEESSSADAFIAQALGLVLERLGRVKEAFSVYDEAIARRPHDGELILARGLARYDVDQPAALRDFAAAARLRVASIWPYLFLARHAVQVGTYGEALRYALAAESQPGPAGARAEVYEIIAIALAELGQPPDRVLENFDRALALDPGNERIRDNRALASGQFARPQGGRPGRCRLVPSPPIKSERLRQARSRELNNHTEWLKAWRGSDLQRELASVT